MAGCKLEGALDGGQVVLFGEQRKCAEASRIESRVGLSLQS